MSLKYQPIVSINKSLYFYEVLFQPSIPMKPKEKELFFIKNKSNSKLHEYIINTLSSERRTKKKLRDKKISINIPLSYLSVEENIINLSNIEEKENIILELAEYDEILNLYSICKRLKKMGFSLAIDDYGKGWSNIERVIKMKDCLDIIKFDASWLYKDLNELSQEYKKLCHYDCIIEGVETNEQYNSIRNIGFKYIQGYFISAPINLPF
ncbi:EAL domain-containing protein [Photobacterium kishitanii]|uniref:EAL domain-containing protein n=1 Tax=Photobacterium kishitanii TaxID=318456 RepID=UPI000D157DBB|nr:EAL domain-containing protein [Photobacterium kishitanii]PSU14952.1 hypothetical protein CTM84_20790 [Photobacterium kishitanii]